MTICADGWWEGQHDHGKAMLSFLSRVSVIPSQADDGSGGYSR